MGDLMDAYKENERNKDKNKKDLDKTKLNKEGRITKIKTKIDFVNKAAAVNNLEKTHFNEGMAFDPF